MDRTPLKLSRREDLIAKIVISLFFCAFGKLIGLTQWWGWTSSTVLNHPLGAVYPLNLHGHIVYLNRIQHLWIESATTIGVTSALSMGIWMMILQRKQKRTENMDRQRNSAQL